MILLRKIAAGLALFAVPVLSVAQTKLPANFHMTKLKNGLEILVIEDPSVPLATVEICVRNGSYTEDSAYNGLSHLYEHMFFKANKAIPSQEKFLERINELGISFNGTTSDERVNYFFTLSSKLLPEGLEFMNNAIRYPLFLEQEMKNENPVVDGEFQRAESSPTFALIQQFNRNMWGDLYTRKNAIGIHDVILTATPEKMRVIQQKYYYPNNSILVVAGDVKHDEVYKQVEKLFGDWQPCDFDPFVKWPIPEFSPLTENKKFIANSENARVPIMTVGWHGPDTRNDLKATYAADVFSTVLGLTSSKFQQAMVDGGLALQTQIGYQTCKYTGPIQAFLVLNPGKVREGYAEFLNQVDMFDADDYFTDEQLETAKRQLSIQDVYGKEKTSAYVHTVTFWWASATIDYYTNYIDNLNKVTRKDIQDYVRKYIKGKNSVSGLLLSPKMKEMLKVEKFEDIAVK
ncbi:MAG TPA: pitrilysin family protein [Bacteroidia bacterium]|nr:pitrilysin family protein [Bacteroidia bacterium]HNU34256.1 pitrilysin family protein [Bacteroidia bacterium]